MKNTENSKQDIKFWRETETWQKVEKLVEDTAAKFDRLDHINEMVPNVLRLQCKFTLREDRTFSIQNISECSQLDRYTQKIHKIIRRYLQSSMARRLIKEEIKDSETGNSPGVVPDPWKKVSISVVQQLKRLDAAINSGQSDETELCWFGLAELAHEYLALGYDVACRLNKFENFGKPFETAAVTINRPMLSPEFLEIVLPYAIFAASKKRGHRTFARDRALGELLDVFQAITVHSSDASRRGGYDEPYGPGADFISELQNIFDMEFMPPGSTHAIKRARKIPRSINY